MLSLLSVLMDSAPNHVPHALKHAFALCLLGRQQKGTIALKAVELGRIFSSPFTGPDAKVELFHDATKAGAKTDTTKSLKV